MYFLNKYILVILFINSVYSIGNTMQTPGAYPTFIGFVPAIKITGS